MAISKSRGKPSGETKPAQNTELAFPASSTIRNKFLLFKPPAAAATSLQSCPTLCNSIDGSPPGSSIHGIFQARVLEWGAIAFSAAIHINVSILPQTPLLFRLPLNSKQSSMFLCLSILNIAMSPCQSPTP